MDPIASSAGTGADVAADVDASVGTGADAAANVATGTGTDAAGGALVEAQRLRAVAHSLLAEADRLDAATGAESRPGEFPLAAVEPAHMRTLLAYIPAEVFLVDADGRVQLHNQDLAAAVGAGQRRGAHIEECLGLAGDLAPDAAAAAEGLRAVLAGARGHSLTDYTWHAGPQRRWLRVVVTPLLPGRRCGAVIVCMDVTDRRIEQDAMRRSEEKFRLLFRSNPHPMWVFDQETLRFLEVNQAAINRYGWSEDEFKAMTIADIRPPDQRETLTRYLEECSVPGLVHAGLWQHVNRAGDRLDVEIHSDELRLEGRAARIVLAIDVSEREATARQLRISEERLRFLARATVDTIWDWDLVSNELWWNQGVHYQFGYDTGELAADNQAWIDRLHPDDVERVVDGLHATIAGTATEWQAEYRFRCKDGNYADIVDRGFVIRDEQGRALRVVGGMNDVTRQRALENQLRQSQRLETVGQLTGGIAHDFNNLLTVIIGNAELLNEALQPAQPELAELSDMIATAAGMGAELTRRLLAFARRQALQPQAIDVATLVASIEPLLRRTLGGNIEVAVTSEAAVWTTLVDPGELENALINLCVNARDAMPGGGRLAIEIGNATLDADYVARYPDANPGDHVVVSVTDTGCGIAADQLERVFEPFYSTKPMGHGTGLGLSMVYGFVRQTRGHVGIYSEPGVGTTVRIYLPRLCRDGEGAESQPVREVPAGGGELVLLVEDDDLVRRYAREQLRQLGYGVLCAAGGDEALNMLARRTDIDLLLTDVIMPGRLDGRQLADAARALRPELPVLFASGYPQDAIVHQGRLDPDVLLLAKPYRRADLALKLRQALASSPVATGTP